MHSNTCSLSILITTALWGKGCNPQVVGKQAEAGEEIACPGLLSEHVGSGGSAWPGLQTRSPILPTSSFSPSSPSCSSSSRLIFSYYKEQKIRLFLPPSLDHRRIWPRVLRLFGDTSLTHKGRHELFKLTGDFSHPGCPLFTESLLRQSQGAVPLEDCSLHPHSAWCSRRGCHNVSTFYVWGGKRTWPFQSFPVS